MDESVPVQQRLSDQLPTDTTVYGSGPDDSISDATESAAVTHHSITIDRATISYTALAGHLVTYDQDSAQPSAKIFYVSFSKNDAAASSRPVTFFYNGGPGSSSVFLLLGSFGPRRIKTSMPKFTPPAPYMLEDNAETLLDRTDLVFINPVGTGYSAAIAPMKNKDFWGVDKDARSIKQFIKRYLTVYNRWNSPKYLFGESYGTPRTCVLTWLLHEDGVDLNGVVLQSSILDTSKPNASVGILPTLAADAKYHNKVNPPPKDLPSFMKQVKEFARGPFAKAMEDYPEVNQGTVQLLSQILGIPLDVLKYWKFDPNIGGDGSVYLASLLLDERKTVGLYDGRVKANNTGIAGSVDPNSGANDPSITAVGGVYTAMWNVYLNEELKYTSTSPFMDLNDQAFKNWDWSHVDPTGADKGGDFFSLYTAGDLAASMEINPYLKVFCANGYYDAVTPFFQTELDLEKIPIGDPESRRNLVFCTYESGHMIYLDDDSRKAMKKDLGAFYDQLPHVVARTAELASRSKDDISWSRYRRRFSRTPY
jgi:carboxypeptidase C (cathepsin A)